MDLFVTRSTPSSAASKAAHVQEKKKTEEKKPSVKVADFFGVGAVSRTERPTPPHQLSERW